jgi:hypothetical protein
MESILSWTSSRKPPASSAEKNIIKIDKLLVITTDEVDWALERMGRVLRG